MEHTFQDESNIGHLISDVKKKGLSYDNQKKV